MDQYIAAHINQSLCIGFKKSNALVKLGFGETG